MLSRCSLWHWYFNRIAIIWTSELFLLGVCWARWMCRLFSINLESPWTLFFKNIFLSLFLLLYFWDSHYAYVATFKGILQVSEALFLCFVLFIFSTCFSFCSSYWIVSINLSSSLLILSSNFKFTHSSASLYLSLTPASKFYISIIVFLNSRISISLFSIISISIDFLYMLKYSCHTFL